MKNQMRLGMRIFLCLFLPVFLGFTGCGESGSDGAPGAVGPAGPSGVEIYSIVASPAVLRPGESTNLSVAAGDGANSALTYLWQADHGGFSSSTSVATTWTAPESVGSYQVGVEVTNTAGLKSKGYASILVTVSPAGPVVTSVNPLEVKKGGQIRISGAGFGNTQKTNQITINGVPVTEVESWSDSAVYATVPEGASTGPVVITVSGVKSSPGYVVVLWQGDNPENTAICTYGGTQTGSTIISDGSGGTIITWQDYRNGPYDIYAQRVNSSGTVLWAVDGISVCSMDYAQSYPQIVSDGAGGAFIVWQDIRNGADHDIYAQRINGNGELLWPVGGVEISTAANTQTGAQIISDGADGAIIVWADGRNGSDNDIYAQRVNSSGTALWTENGVAVCTAANEQFSHRIIADGSGGVIIVWDDQRSGTIDVYAQRLSSSGAILWASNGVPICTAVNAQYDPKLISDNSGGAIMVWTDSRGTAYDIYAQRVDSSGSVQWSTDGVGVCTAANSQAGPQIFSDDSGGAIITWSDGRSGTDSDIYAQRLTSKGLARWTPQGIPICMAASGQIHPKIDSDGSGGAIVVWQDQRNGLDDIYAQRVTSSGIVLWSSDGVAISTDTKPNEYPEIISDGSGGAIMVWQTKVGSQYDIYAQGVSASGRL